MSKKILIAEDDESTITLIAQKLERAGYHVYLASNGINALGVLNQESIDLIVTDVVMPEMDGVDLYKAIKSNARLYHIPIIIITDSEIFKNSFSALGVQNFVPKPLKAEDLITKIGLILDSKSANSDKGDLLILGTNPDVNEDMVHLLEEIGHSVRVTLDGAEFLANALTLAPQLGFIDILTKNIPARQIIKACTCFDILHDMKIIAFAYITPSELGDVEMVEQLRQSKDACIEAGAHKYIGRFSKATFIQSVNEFLNIG